MIYKKAILTKPGKFIISEDEVDIQPDQLLIKILVCGLCSWEENHFEGRLGNCPQTLGHEWAGEVVEVGTSVTGFSVGDKVAVLPDGLYGFATYAAVSAKNCFHLSSNIDPRTALGEPLKCIITVLRATQPEVGDIGVIFGCGSMGLWCIQALTGNGLSELIAVDTDPERLELAKKYGATHILNAQILDIPKEIERITEGHMADFIIDGTGVPSALVGEINCLRTSRGRLILMSSHSREASEMDFRPAIERGIEIRVPHPSYSLDPLDDMRRAIDLLNRGKFVTDGIITHTFSLEDIQLAFETMKARPNGYIKGVVYPNNI